MFVKVNYKETILVKDDNDILEIINYILIHQSFFGNSPCMIQEGLHFKLIKDILKQHKKNKIEEIIFSFNSDSQNFEKDQNFFNQITYKTKERGFIETDILKREKRIKFELIEDSISGETILKKLYQLQEIFNVNNIHYNFDSDLELSYKQFNELLQECKTDEEYEKLCREEEEHIISIMISYIENACDHDERILSLYNVPYWNKQIYKQNIEKVYKYKIINKHLYRTPFDPFRNIRDKSFTWEKVEINS